MRSGRRSKDQQIHAAGPPLRRGAATRFDLPGKRSHPHRNADRRCRRIDGRLCPIARRRDERTAASQSQGSTRPTVGIDGSIGDSQREARRSNQHANRQRNGPLAPRPSRSASDLAFWVRLSGDYFERLGRHAVPLDRLAVGVLADRRRRCSACRGTQRLSTGPTAGGARPTCFSSSLAIGAEVTARRRPGAVSSVSGWREWIFSDAVTLTVLNKHGRIEASSSNRDATSAIDSCLNFGKIWVTISEESLALSFAACPAVETSLSMSTSFSGSARWSTRPTEATFRAIYALNKRPQMRHNKLRELLAVRLSLFRPPPVGSARTGLFL